MELPKVPAAAAGCITIAADAADEADEAAENLDRKIFPKRDLLGWQLHCHRNVQNAHRRISIMQPSKELIDELFWERVESARRMLPEEKLIAGFQLYDLACKIIADGIRNEHPDADESQVQEILRERLALAQRLEVLSDP